MNKRKVRLFSFFTFIFIPWLGGDAIIYLNLPF
ncbi:Uncharacterised protein [Yersinia pseudotuberculosis]|nr:Uncharacterised protein [Yersinia pseudotuberculosis]CNH80930.1 Uncharacterised protein [Yersinia pseudotuberculosis]